MPATNKLPSERLCAITCYFNPGGFKSLRRNFEIFSLQFRKMKVPLVTVECSFGEQPFELPDGPNVLRVRASKILWLKEHLLNFAINRIPDSFDMVAWLDCDILFCSQAWAVETEAALHHAQVVQLFEKAIRLPPGATTFRGIGDRLTSTAAICSVDSTRIKGGRTEHGCTGFAWAARRDFLRSIRLYEGCVIGGADHLMAHAFYGDWQSDCVLQTIGHSEMYHHYRYWAERAFAATQGKVGVVPGDVLHLWHGHPTNRRYIRRWKQLREFRFNPYTDVDWSKFPPCWSAHRGDLAEWAKNYFLSRKEDSLAFDPESGTRFLF